MKRKSGTLVRVITGVALLSCLAACVLLGPVTRLCFFYAVVWFCAREMSDALNRMGFVTSPWDHSRIFSGEARVIWMEFRFLIPAAPEAAAMSRTVKRSSMLIISLPWQEGCCLCRPA